MLFLYFEQLQVKLLLRWAVLVLAVGLLSGCSSFGGFRIISRAVSEPSETTERARIRVISFPAMVIGFPNASCMELSNSEAGIVYATGGNLSSTGFRNRELGMPSSKFYEDTSKKRDIYGQAEFYAAANQPITLNMRYAAAGYSCALPIAFIPEKNQDYEIVFDVDDKRCFSRIISLTEHGKKVPLAKVERCEPGVD